MAILRVNVSVFLSGGRFSGDHWRPGLGDHRGTEQQGSLARHGAICSTNSCGTARRLRMWILATQPPNHSPARWINLVGPRITIAYDTETATVADAGRLLAALEDVEREKNKPGIHALFALLLFTGCRRGEALGLRWSDVDLDRRIITVRRSYASMTKSGKQRTVPVATGLAAILKAHKTADPWKGELVFPNDSGEMYSRNAKLEEMLELALTRVGLPRITVHQLRHAMASFFVMNGGDIFTLQKILGHSTPQLVSDTYAHLSQDHLTGEADRLSFPAPKRAADVIPFARPAAARTEADSARIARATLQNKPKSGATKSAKAE